MPEKNEKDSFTFSEKLKSSSVGGTLSKRIPSKLKGSGKIRKTLIERVKRDAPYYITALLLLLILPLLGKFDGFVTDDGIFVPSEEMVDASALRTAYGSLGIVEGELVGEGEAITEFTGRNPLDLIAGRQAKKADRKKVTKVTYDLIEAPKAREKRDAWKGGAIKKAIQRPTTSIGKMAKTFSIGGGKGGSSTSGVVPTGPRGKAYSGVHLRSSTKPLAQYPLQVKGKRGGEKLYSEAARSLGAMPKSGASTALREAQLDSAGGVGAVGGIGGIGESKSAGSSGGAYRPNKFQYGILEPYWWSLKKMRDKKWMDIEFKLYDKAINVGSMMACCLLFADPKCEKFVWNKGASGGKGATCCGYAEKDWPYDSSWPGSNNNPKWACSQQTDKAGKDGKDCKWDGGSGASSGKNAWKTRMSCLNINRNKGANKEKNDCKGVNNDPIEFEAVFGKKRQNRDGNNTATLEYEHYHFVLAKLDHEPMVQAGFDAEKEDLNLEDEDENKESLIEKVEIAREKFFEALDDYDAKAIPVSNDNDVDIAELKNQLEKNKESIKALEEEKEKINNKMVNIYSNANAKKGDVDRNNRLDKRVKKISAKIKELEVENAILIRDFSAKKTATPVTQQASEGKDPKTMTDDEKKELLKRFARLESEYGGTGKIERIVSRNEGKIKTLTHFAQKTGTSQEDKKEAETEIKTLEDKNLGAKNSEPVFEAYDALYDLLGKKQMKEFKLDKIKADEDAKLYVIYVGKGKKLGKSGHVKLMSILDRNGWNKNQLKKIQARAVLTSKKKADPVVDYENAKIIPGEMTFGDFEAKYITPLEDTSLLGAKFISDGKAECDFKMTGASFLEKDIEKYDYQGNSLGVVKCDVVLTRDGRVRFKVKISDPDKYIYAIQAENILKKGFSDEKTDRDNEAYSYQKHSVMHKTDGNDDDLDGVYEFTSDFFTVGHGEASKDSDKQAFSGIVYWVSTSDDKFKARDYAETSNTKIRKTESKCKYTINTCDEDSCGDKSDTEPGYRYLYDRNLTFDIEKKGNEGIIGKLSPDIVPNKDVYFCKVDNNGYMIVSSDDTNGLIVSNPEYLIGAKGVFSGNAIGKCAPKTSKNFSYVNKKDGLTYYLNVEKKTNSSGKEVVNVYPPSSMKAVEGVSFCKDVPTIPNGSRADVIYRIKSLNDDINGKEVNIGKPSIIKDFLDFYKTVLSEDVSNLGDCIACEKESGICTTPVFIYFAHDWPKVTYTSFLTAEQFFTTTNETEYLPSNPRDLKAIDKDADNINDMDSFIDSVDKENDLITLVGFTSSSGNIVDNEALSARRIAVIREYLLGKGIKGKFIQFSFAKGESFSDASQKDNPKDRVVRITSTPAKPYDLGK